MPDRFDIYPDLTVSGDGDHSVSARVGQAELQVGPPERGLTLWVLEELQLRWFQPRVFREHSALAGMRHDECPTIGREHHGICALLLPAAQQAYERLTGRFRYIPSKPDNANSIDHNLVAWKIEEDGLPVVLLSIEHERGLKKCLAGAGANSVSCRVHGYVL